MADAIITRYHTRAVAGNVIKAPKIAVKPHIKTIR